MKKKEIKKLQLSRETLQALTSSDFQKVVGGQDPISNQSNRGPCDCSN